MDEKILLIVNADDFGLSPGVNRGIIEAHEQGVVTSTSLMVRWPGAKDAAAYGRRNQSLSLGLHLDLGEWSFKEGEWVPEYVVVDSSDADAVAREVRQQIEEFRRLVGDDPTHLDSHQHVHQNDPAKSVLQQWARKLGVPLRHFTREIHYCGEFYGQTAEGLPLTETISVEALLRILECLMPGCTELACHPGYPEGLKTMYQKERELELKVLCEPRVLEKIKKLGIKLCSFRHVVNSM